MPRVDEQKSRRTLSSDRRCPEKALHQLVEARRSTTCKPVARQVDEIERCTTATCDAVDIRQPGLPRGGAGASQTLPHERVDQTRFADVRTADQGDLW
jgi:hypothetical protein